MSLFRDERGNRSAARIILVGWLTQTAAYVWACLWLKVQPDGVVLSVDSAVALALIGWAAGPRVAQYLMPQIGAVTKSVADAIQKRRASGEYEETR